MTVALSYSLKRKCGNMRPFCRECINSFSMDSCETDCTDAPSVICLRPRKPTGEYSCCPPTGDGSDDAPVGTPGLAIVTLAPVDGSCSGECCCDDLPTTLYLVFDSTLNVWYTDIPANGCFHTIYASLTCSTLRCDGSTGGSSISLVIRGYGDFPYNVVPATLWAGCTNDTGTGMTCLTKNPEPFDIPSNIPLPFYHLCNIVPVGVTFKYISED